MGSFLKYGLIMIFLVLLAGCDPYKQDSFQSQYSVMTYLVANDMLPSIRLSKTQPAKNNGNTSDLEVPDAHITINEMNNQGNVINSIEYQYGGGNIYTPISSDRVVPGGTYDLNIDITSDNHQVKARCIIPGDFHIRLESPGTVKYQQPGGINLLSTPSTYPGRAGYYVIAAVARKPDIANLTPYFANKVTNNSDTPTSSLEKVSSRIFNAGDFKTDGLGNLIMTVPWEIFAFYGENQIIVYALDDNTYDFLRSLDVQYGSTQVTNGQLYNLIYHVQGGIGLFGGIATDTVSVTVTR